MSKKHWKLKIMMNTLDTYSDESFGQSTRTIFRNISTGLETLKKAAVHTALVRIFS